jgi:hypothetical protein
MSSQHDRAQDGHDIEEIDSSTGVLPDPGVHDPVAETDDADMPRRPDRWLWIPTC